MLQKAERLKEKSLFNFAFKKKQKVTSNLLHLYYLLRKKDINKLPDLPKTAFIVSLKVDKRATKRNLIKRRMKAAYQLLKKRFIYSNKIQPYVLIWIANPNIKGTSFKDIKDAMENIFKKLEKIEHYA